MLVGTLRCLCKGMNNGDIINDLKSEGSSNSRVQAKIFCWPSWNMRYDFANQ